MEDQDFDVFVRVPIPRGDFVDPPPVSLGLVELSFEAAAPFYSTWFVGLTSLHSGQLGPQQGRSFMEDTFRCGADRN
jgi:hypothetical protein